MMKSISEIGLKITPATREYFRYTGVSAEVERRRIGCSRPELAWSKHVKKQEEEQQRAGSAAVDLSRADQSKEKSRK